mmetsp:Transcript_131214/g.280671  ORF Transcript_131214/g.280671 Transcript_131214/m.280671 type:complete len:574 (-) Transcript_131214:843-2564(-)
MLMLLFCGIASKVPPVFSPWKECRRAVVLFPSLPSVVPMPKMDSLDRTTALLGSFEPEFPAKALRKGPASNCCDTRLHKSSASLLTTGPAVSGMTFGSSHRSGSICLDIRLHASSASSLTTDFLAAGLRPDSNFIISSLEVPLASSSSLSEVLLEEEDASSSVAEGLAGTIIFGGLVFVPALLSTVIGNDTAISESDGLLEDGNDFEPRVFAFIILGLVLVFTGSCRAGLESASSDSASSMADSDGPLDGLLEDCSDFIPASVFDRLKPRFAGILGDDSWISDCSLHPDALLDWCSDFDIWMVFDFENAGLASAFLVAAPDGPDAESLCLWLFFFFTANEICFTTFFILSRLKMTSPLMKSSWASSPSCLPTGRQGRVLGLLFERTRGSSSILMDGSWDSDSPTQADALLDWHSDFDTARVFRFTGTLLRPPGDLSGLANVSPSVSDASTLFEALLEEASDFVALRGFDDFKQPRMGTTIFFRPEDAASSSSWEESDNCDLLLADCSGGLIPSCEEARLSGLAGSLFDPFLDMFFGLLDGVSPPVPGTIREPALGFSFWPVFGPPAGISSSPS